MWAAEERQKVEWGRCGEIWAAIYNASFNRPADVTYTAAMISPYATAAERQGQQEVIEVSGKELLAAMGQGLAKLQVD